MFSKLVVVALFSVCHASLLAQDWRGFSKSAQWHNLLHYQKTFTGLLSKAHEETFFVSKNGRHDPAQELEASLQAIENQTPVGHNKELFSCAFPARYSLLKQFLTNRKDEPCPNLEAWIKGFSATKAYLVYSSSYPNNPASLFGHTFLRFDRLVHDKQDHESDLRGYSVAFMASSDPTDNPMLFTYRGITGAYQGYLDIKPFYMSIGLYNNAESRDLWEYDLRLSSQEIHFLLQHLWEISNQTGFPYYFFDGNCSTFMVRLLEIVRPELDFSSKKGFFVIPQETLREAVTLFQKNHPSARYRSSIGKKILYRLQSMTPEERKDYQRGKVSLEALENTTNKRVLETLALNQKYTNYKKQAQLTEQEQILFLKTFTQLSRTKDGRDFSITEQPVEKEGPALSHPAHRLSLLTGKELIQGSLRYGLHDFGDTPDGYPTYSYINFMDLEWQNHHGKNSISRFEFINIKSLEIFHTYSPQLSWTASLSFYDLNQANFPQSALAYGGIGLSHEWSFFQFYLLPGMATFNNRWDYYSRAILSSGIKWRGPEGWQWSTEYLQVFNSNIFKHQLKSELFYYWKPQHSFGISFKENFNRTYSLGPSVNFYF